MPLFTPDGRYLVIEGKHGPRLWRAANPALDEQKRQALVAELMDARRSLRGSIRGEAESEGARLQVHRAKVALGERGAVWWDDGSPDFNRRLIKNTPYADWWSAFSAEQSD